MSARIFELFVQYESAPVPAVHAGAHDTTGEIRELHYGFVVSSRGYYETHALPTSLTTGLRGSSVFESPADEVRFIEQAGCIFELRIFFDIARPVGSVDCIRTSSPVIRFPSSSAIG